MTLRRALLGAIALAAVWFVLGKPWPKSDEERLDARIDRARGGDADALRELVRMGAPALARVEHRFWNEVGVKSSLWPLLDAFGAEADPILLLVLRRADDANAREAARRIARGRPAPEGAVDELVAAVPHVGDDALQALARIGPTAMARVLDSVRAGGDADSAATALRAFGPEAVAALAALVSGDHPIDARRRAARALGGFGARALGARSHLAAFLEDRVGAADADGVADAAYGLAALGVEGARDLVAAAERHGDASILDGAWRSPADLLPVESAAAASALPELRETLFGELAVRARMTDAERALAVRALDDAAGGVRAAAAWAIAEGGGGAELGSKLLAIARDDADFVARARAADAYRRVTGDDAAVLELLLRDLGETGLLEELDLGVLGKKGPAAKVLAKIGAPALPGVLDALDTDDRRRREQAFRVLADLERSLPPHRARLEALAKSPRETVRERAAWLLERLASR